MDLDGPKDKASITAEFAKAFQEKTGASWGSIKPGDRVPPGKYWYQKQATPDLKARWEYWIDDGVDGKRPGWYPYTPSASAEVEEIFAQHVANDRESRTANRLVKSGHFSYKVELDDMMQENSRTHKRRTIRRVMGEEEGSVPDPRTSSPFGVPVLKPMKKMKAVPMRANVMRATLLKKPSSSGLLKRPSSMSLTVRKSSMKKAKKAKTPNAVKKVSKYGSKSKVFRGLKVKTRKRGLTASQLVKNKKGKVVSKRKSEAGKKVYYRIAKWTEACKKARTELGLKGFVLCKKGSEFYNCAKAHMSTGAAA